MLVSVPLVLEYEAVLTRPDEMVLETAVNGNADDLATFNLRHLREAAAVFGIKAAVPGRSWQKIRSEYEKE